MENPDMMPTTADYANSNAQEAKSKVEKLEQEVAGLKRRLMLLEHEYSRIMSKLRSLND